MNRTDYAYPFRIDPASGQGARAPYGAHVEQMIWQILLTSPGERIDLPEFGCGLRKLLFAPNIDDATPTPPQAPAVADALHASTRLVVREALDRWLAGTIDVQDVTVARQPDLGSVVIEVQYILIETRSLLQTQVTI